MLPAFAYIRPTRLQDVVARLSGGDAKLHAGGTDLLGCLHDGVFITDTVVSLGALEKDLNAIRETDDGGLELGAMTRVAQIAEDETIGARYSVLAQAAASVGSPQLRNQGTLGGNLCQKPRCWYYRGDFACLRKGGFKCFAVNGENQYHAILGGANCFIVHPSDIAPALVALDAEIRTAGPEGGRRIAAAELHMPPSEDPRRETRLKDGEVIVSVRLPGTMAGRYSRYRKVRARQAWDFALAACALNLELDGDRVRDCRIALAGAAPVPWRSKQAEQALKGEALTAETIQAVAKAAMAEADPMSQNGYKVALFEGLITEMLEQAAKAG